MQITRFNRINHRIFQDFSWPADLHDFGHFNLIYGWNGSGKTTLANLFAHLERRANVTEGTIELTVNGTAVSGRDFDSACGLSKVRVFDRSRVDLSVSSAATPLGLVYYFGEESVEKRRQLEALKSEAATMGTDLGKAQTAQGSAEARLDEFCVQQARTIKELLTASDGGPYNNYNKSNFRTRSDDMAISGDAESKALSEEIKAGLKLEKDQRPKSELSIQALRIPKLTDVTAETESLLSKTVVSQVIARLKDNEDIATWVKEGLALHGEAGADELCEFCRGPLSAERIAELEAHFNDEYERLLGVVDAKRATIEADATALRASTFPISAELYEQFSAAYTEARDQLQQAVGDVADYLSALAGALSEKRTKPFGAMALAQFLLGKNAAADSAAAAHEKTWGKLISQHNARTADFGMAVQAARKKLEDGFVAESMTEFSTHTTSIQSAKERAAKLTTKVGELRTKISDLEKTLVEHRKPADELNEELRSFLGRDDIKLDVRDTGYTITRNGIPASNLSEGEKSAIAFLYFLKSLQDRAFELSKSVVVIDDPVSSLDANALFSAFGHMKSRTKSAGQLFVLTHNFAFFRQVKNWFHHMPHQKKEDVKLRPARFFMLIATGDGTRRRASICPLDHLLEEFESEYHYLFHRVHGEANRPSGTTALAECYPLPNLARRLLEAFLAFRFPSVAGELMPKLERVAFDEHKKVRILRFLHTFSHGDKVDEAGHDPTLLAEAPQVMAEILELMRTEDARHYDEMLVAIGADAPAP
jgi:wobble nucleotide-excising tRNase